MISALEYHEGKCKYHLNELEMLYNAHTDKNNLSMTISMINKAKSRYEQHKRFCEIIRGEIDG